MTDSRHSTLLVALEALRRRRTIGLLAAITVLAVAVPFALGLPNVYQASANLIVEGQFTDLLGSGGAAHDVDGRLQAIKQEALSRSRLIELIETFDLYPELRQQMPVTAVVDQVQREIRVEPTNVPDSAGRVSTVSFRLSYLGRDPAKVAQIANKLASFYIEQNEIMRSRQVTKASDFLKSEVEDAKKRLDQQQQRLLDYQKRNDGMLPTQLEANLSKLRAIDSQLSQNAGEQTRLVEQQAGLRARVADLRANPRTDAFDPKTRLAVAQKELEDLLITQTRDNPNVVAKQREIEQIKKQVDAAGTGTSANQATTLDLLEQEIANIDGRLDKLRQAAVQLRTDSQQLQTLIDAVPMHSIEFDSVTRDYQTAREHYDSLLKQYDQAQITERAEMGLTGRQFRILDPAIAPTGPAAPNRNLLIFCALIGALVLGVGSALLVDYFDTSFHSVDDLRAFTHVPVLASIPRIVTRRDTVWRVVLGSAVAGAAAAVLVLLGASTFQLAQGSERITRLLLRLG